MVLHKWPFWTVYDIVLLTKSTFLTADTILWYTKYPVPNRSFSFPSPYKKYKPCSHRAPSVPTNFMYTH